MFNKEEIQMLNLREISGKKLTMNYTEEDGYGILAGIDEKGTIYVLSEYKNKEAN